MPKKFKPENVYLAGGFAHPQLAEDIARELGVELGGVEEKRQPVGETYSRFSESVRGKHVFLIQSHVPGENTNIDNAIMQQMFMANAARSSSAAEITAVSPHFGYARLDRKTRGREPLGAQAVMDALAVNGVNRIVTLDIHAQQVQNAFRGPFDHLTAQRALEKAMLGDLAQYDHDSLIVVAPDAGASKLAQSHQRRLDTDLMLLTKKRERGNSQKISRDEKVPEVDGRVCLVFDDMIDTAGTLVTAVEALKNSGAKAVYVGASHGIFSNPALERLRNAPIDRLYTTDTFSQVKAQAELGDKLRVVSVAPIIGRAISEIMTGGSISNLFDDENYM